MENATVKNTVDGQIENVSGNCRGNGRSVGMRQLIHGHSGVATL